MELITIPHVEKVSNDSYFNRSYVSIEFQTMKRNRLLLIMLCLSYANSQSQENSAEISEYDYSNCETHTSCYSCFMEHESCKWCAHSEIHTSSNSFPPCSSQARLRLFGCPEEYILNMREPERKIIEDKNFTDVYDQIDEQPIQLKPQHISVLFSPFKTEFIEFEYRPVKDYPLDLYVLLDLTYSMKDDRETLVKLNANLLNVLSDLTKNFRLAFGSFADKPLMPYSSNEEKRKNNPCSVEGDVCEMTYDFRHMLNFTTDLKIFAEAVANSSITGNLDNADGGFDALMQVLVCGDRIGWNPKSRKIILIATDSLPHFAGDGKLGGVVQINDKQCHLDDNGHYSKAEVMDYPSLEQIYKILDEKRISVIFAVVEEFERIYIEIEKLLPENTFVGRLEADSSNILSLIKQGYENIVKTVNFEVSEDEDLEFVLFSDCGRENSTFFENAKCTNVEYGKTYKFKMGIKLKENRWNINNKFTPKRIYISDLLLGQDLIAIDVDINTNCNCSKTDLYLNMTCPSNGYFECGKCNCLEGWSGIDCQCNKNKGEAFQDKESCRNPDTNLMCSSNGECVCGSCECDYGWAGQFCNCRECPRNSETGIQCSSKNKGRCSCGECICRKGWSGVDCSCSDSKCMSPWNEALCSGNGQCRCGTCKCFEKNGRNYTGKYCETCSSCDNPACSLYEPCVRQELKLKNDIENPCTSADGTMYLPTIVSEYYTGVEDVGECLIRIDDEYSVDYSCRYVYTYKIEKDWNTVLSIYTRECEGILQKGSVVVSLGVALALALVVLSVIAWKIYDSVSYNREYRKFQAEQTAAMSKTDNISNPLYRSPISEFKVPENFYRENSSTSFEE